MNLIYLRDREKWNCSRFRRLQLKSKRRLVAVYGRRKKSKHRTVKMDILPSGNIFRELQVVHDTGYFSAQASLEDRWQQVCDLYLTYFICV